jgi:hypothetical protein
VALAWPRPQTADAIAMANPAVIATQLVPAAAPPCANAGTAKHMADIAINKQLSLRSMVFSPRAINLPQWVVDVILVQTPSRCGRVFSSQFSVLSSLGFAIEN